MYLYTENQWKLTHDAKECPHSDADLKSFKYRYFISPPASKIGRNGWTQVKVKAERTITRAWEGDEIKNVYSIDGRGVLRLGTAHGNYDHAFDCNLEVQEIPL